MIEKEIQEAIQKVYALNNECPENTDIYAFPLDTVIFEAMMKYLKDFKTSIFLPKSKGDKDDDCPYAIASTENDGNGFSIFVFVSGEKTEKCIEAIRKIMVGEEPD